MLIADIAGYRGRLTYDKSKPDGTPRKLLDISRLRALGWSSRIGLREGIAAVYRGLRVRPHATNCGCGVHRHTRIATMKAVILAGGLGTRISEESHLKPKPMIEIGGKPILWHIMKIYSAHGINDFIVCCGYKGYVIKEYFANYFLHMSDVTFDMANNKMQVHQASAEPWRVTLVDTGDDSRTGGRLKRVRVLSRRRTVSASPTATASATSTWARLVELLEREKVLAVVTAVQPAGRFGAPESRPLARGQLRGKTTRRRQLDQWRIFRALAEGDRLHRRRHHELGSGRSAAHCARRPACRVPPHGFLAADGHPARQDTVSRICGAPARHRGKSGRESAASGRGKRSCSPVTPDSRADGWRCGCRRWAPR